MTTQIHLWVIGLFSGIWLIEMLRQRQIGCLLIGLMLWLAMAISLVLSFSVYENFFLYQIFGAFGLGFPLHFVHLWIFVGSAIYVLRHNQKLSDRRESYRLPSPLLSLFATSGFVMHLSVLTLLILMGFMPNQDNQNHQMVLLTRLANLYFLNPVQWYAWQTLLMLIFFLHRQWIMRESPAIFSIQQIQAGFLMILPLQFFYVLNGQVWLPQIIRFILRN